MPLVWVVAASGGFAVAAVAVALAVVGRSRHRRAIVVALALAAGAVGAVGPSAAATGIEALDAVYRYVLIGLLAYLGARLRTDVLLVAVLAVALLSGGQDASGGWALAGAGAVVAALLTGRPSSRSRANPAAAVAAACCGLSALEPGWELATGASGALSAAVLLPLLVLGYRRAPKDERQRLRRAGLLVTSAAVVLAVLGLLALAQARPSLTSGVMSAQRAVRDARDLDGAGAARSFTTSARQLGTAHRQLSSAPGRAGLLVPLLGQQLRALDAAAERGSSLSRAGGSLAQIFDPATLRIEDGHVPIERLTAAKPEADEAARAIASASRSLSARRSPWLLPPLARRFDRVAAQLEGATKQADSARFLVAEAPRLLGAEGPRRYFVAVQSEAEIRGAGGFLGGYAEILADQGRLTLVKVGRSSDLNAASTGPPIVPDAPPDFQRRYGRYDFLDTWQNVTISPSFPADAQLIRGLYPQSGGAPVDAVLAIDPFAIEAFLRVTGPLEVPGSPQRLDGTNASRILLYEQYRSYPDTDQSDRRDFLADVTGRLSQRLLTQPVDLVALGKALVPMAEQKHVMASAGANAEDPAFVRLGITGAMQPVRGDAFGVVNFNANPSKIDWFLRRKVDYRATHDVATGALEATATITLTNQAPAGGLPAYIIGNRYDLPPGTNRTSLAVYSPLLLTSATIDGQPLLVDAEAELGRSVYSTLVAIGPGQTRTLVLRLRGATLPGTPYTLDLHRQPSAAPDDVTVSVDAGAGMRSAHYTLNQDETFDPRPRA